MTTNISKRLVLIIAVLAIGTVFTQAMPPLPKEDGTAFVNKSSSYYLSNYRELKQAGLDQPSNANILEYVLKTENDAINKIAAVSGNFNILAVLVNFSDKASTTLATDYDSLLFSTSGSSVWDYYNTVSYGQLDIITVNLPSSNGWLTAPQTYAYYVNNQNGMGTYPNNCQKLVEDLVSIIDPAVDFSNYDNNSDGYVDVMVIIHAGPGAEVTSANTDIWSHKWNTSSPRSTGDGVSVFEYTIQPEYVNVSGDATIGVYCHELGHAFGLPDLYDIDNSSYGIGYWGIMSYGSWGGVNGNLPTGPCAWSKIQLGFTSATNITSNTNNQAINDVKVAGDIYRLWSSGSIGNEYFLVENRQKTGYDGDLPGAGLIIWHIDDGKATGDNSDNTQEWYPGQPGANHLRVAVEQADGLYEIEHKNDLGDVGDVFISGREFNALSSATSDSYLSGVSFVAVENISTAGATMYADLKVSLAAGVNNNDNNMIPDRIVLHQNYPNPFNPSTVIDFYLPERNHVNLSIYNVLGQEVDVLINEILPSGTNSVTWDGTDKNGDEVASGIYFYKIKSGNDGQIRKMVLVR